MSIDPRLNAALEPVLADLRRTLDLEFALEPSQWSEVRGQLTAMMRGRDGSGMGVSIMAADDDSQRVVSITDQVQEFVIEALWKDGRPATWPECPAHPATHPLKPVDHHVRPPWVCPASGQAKFAIGALGAYGRVSD